MSRPRIRSIKPEIWQDEDIGDLSNDARVLLIGLVTMADDEGRLRANTTQILGHIFPYDDVPPAKLKRWVKELADINTILTYVVDGKPYIAFRHWKRHQKINRANRSELPPPPDPQVVMDNSLKDPGENMDSVGPHARARGSRSDPDPEVLPKGFETRLASAVEACLPILRRTAEARGSKPVTLVAVARAIESHPKKDHRAIAGDLEHWLVHGNGVKRPAKDVVSRFRNFLSDAPDVPALSAVPSPGEDSRSKYDRKTREVSA